MKQKVKDILKAAMVVLAALVLFTFSFTVCETVHQTCAYMRRGNGFGTAVGLAVDNVGGRLYDTISIWIPEKDEGYTTYPMANARIDWNTLNKK